MGEGEVSMCTYSPLNKVNGTEVSFVVIGIVVQYCSNVKTNNTFLQRKEV